MADFCKECNDELFGEDCNCDVAGLCKKDEMVAILCEGHGKTIWVDHKGKEVK